MSNESDTASAPDLLLLCGLPGSGKSTIASELEQEGDWVVICPDDFRLHMTGDTFNQIAEKGVWRAAFAAAATQLSRGRSVIVDACNTTFQQRGKWYHEAREFNAVLRCIWVHESLAVCRERNSKRESPVPEEVLNRMARNFAIPTKKLGRFESIEIRGDATSAEQHLALAEENFAYEGLYKDELEPTQGRYGGR